MAAMRYLTVDELVYINEQVLTGETIHTIVEGKRAVRDIGLLEAAVARPMASAFGADAYPSLSEKAAVLLHSLARNHPFADGNKRTATVAALFLLTVNSHRVAWEPHEALAWIVAVAEGKRTAESFATWLPLVDTGGVHSVAPTQTDLLQPDAARDLAIIAQITTEHAWLLAELAGR